jgi:hypothetical protein
MSRTSSAVARKAVKSIPMRARVLSVARVGMGRHLSLMRKRPIQLITMWPPRPTNGSNLRQRGSATIDKEGGLMVCTISSERLRCRVLLPPARMRGRSQARLPQR